MAEDKNKAERQGGEFMIQDRDHMGQMGNYAGRGIRQSQQSQSGDRQQGDSHDNGGGQQGAERSQKRSKLL